MQLHHDAHEAAYVNKSNAAILKLTQPPPQSPQQPLPQPAPQQLQPQPQPVISGFAPMSYGGSGGGSDGGGGNETSLAALHARPFATFLVTPGSAARPVGAADVANMSLTQLLMQVWANE